MRLFALFYLCSLVFIGCNKKPAPAPDTTVGTFVAVVPTKVLILKVDYVTGKFEGGVELPLSTHYYSLDTLPVKIEYISPSDFGNLRLLYEPSHDTLFDGGIIWMGTGLLKFPHRFDTATKFLKLPTPLHKPDSARFQKLFPWYHLGDSPPWDAIADLSVVPPYIAAKKKIGFFLYTPSVGIGDPREWDWLFFLSR